MENITLVSKETAILLKEKGFNWKCTCYVQTFEGGGADGHPWGANWNDELEFKDRASQPPLELAQKWLRDVKNLIVIADYSMVYPMKWNYEYWDSNMNFYYSEYFDTYEEALEEGIKEVLKLI